MAYFVDANIFIQAKNLHYGFEFCPAFWDWLDIQNKSENVYSIEKVGDELIAGSDSLAEWAQDRKSSLFLKPDQGMLNSLNTVSKWANSQKYNPAAVSTFLQVADYYLISHALSNGFTVVTHEVASPSVAKIKIPNVCIGLGIKCISPYEMLRTEKARFIL